MALRMEIEEKAKSLKIDKQVECAVQAEAKITEFMSQVDVNPTLAFELLCRDMSLTAIEDVIGLLANFHGSNTTEAKLALISSRLWGGSMLQVEELAATCNGMIETGQSCLSYGFAKAGYRLPDLKVMLLAAKNQKIGRATRIKTSNDNNI